MAGGEVLAGLKMYFAKMHVSGNDFVVVDARNIRRNWSKLSQHICSPCFGVGADGLLVILFSKAADFKARIINPDGSEAETCGNGLLCLAKYAMESNIMDARERKAKIETLAGLREVEVSLARNGKVKGAKVNMGEPKFSPEEIPIMLPSSDRTLVDIKPILNYPLVVAGMSLSLGLVSIGNPHAVHFAQEPISDFPMSEIGQLVENHSMFPQRTNFEVARVLKGDLIEARVWERGVGETRACGSGACAIATVARLSKYIGDEVEILLPGGVLGVEQDSSGEVLLTGFPELVFTGEWLWKEG